MQPRKNSVPGESSQIKGKAEDACIEVRCWVLSDGCWKPNTFTKDGGKERVTCVEKTKKINFIH